VVMLSLQRMTAPSACARPSNGRSAEAEHREILRPNLSARGQKLGRRPGGIGARPASERPHDAAPAAMLASPRSRSRIVRNIDVGDPSDHRLGALAGSGYKDILAPVDASHRGFGIG
jgi:plasmid stability protein